MRDAFLVSRMLSTLLLTSGCDPSSPSSDAATGSDAATSDAATSDAAMPRDAGDVDAGRCDAGGLDDGGLLDAGPSLDAGSLACMPSWHPTSCADCSGGSGGGECTQGCDPISCGDGHHYFARCDDATQVEICACTFTEPTTTLGCEPVEYGGSSCCWKVG